MPTKNLSDLLAQLELEHSLLTDKKPLAFNISPITAFYLLSALQLALADPMIYGTDVRTHALEFAEQLQTQLMPLGPAHQELCQMFWDLIDDIQHYHNLTKGLM